MQVVIVGGGMSGISTAIRLREFLGDRVGVTVSAIGGSHGTVKLWTGG